MHIQRNGTIGILVSIAMAMVLGACGRDDLQLGNDAAITNFRDLITKQPTDLVGRKVDFASITATRVVGDYVWWGGEGRDELPIVLESELNGSGQENAVQIRRGRNYRLNGTVRLVDNVPADSRMWRLMTPAQIADVRRAGIYLGADSVGEQ